MENFSGQVLHNGKVLIGGVSGVLQDYGRGWKGSFSLPQGTVPPVAGETYRLVLDDGRSGEIIVIEANVGSHRTTAIRFQGSGPLQ